MDASQRDGQDREGGASSSEAASGGASPHDSAGSRAGGFMYTHNESTGHYTLVPIEFTYLSELARALGGSQAANQSEGSADEDSTDEEARLTLSAIGRILAARNSYARSRVTNCCSVQAPEPTPMKADNDFHFRVRYDTGQLEETSVNVCRKIEASALSPDCPSLGQKISTTRRILPRHHCLADVFSTKVFCGTYSRSGNLFLSACQNQSLTLYNTEGGGFKRFRTVRARNIGWSILDTDFSPDQQWFIYSTWSPFIQICNVYGEEEKHYQLDLRPEMEDRFCVFKTAFSSDNKEILAAGNDGMLYFYNRELCDRVLVVDAHEDDVNAAAFGDASNNLVYSGGDDGLCKAWDRRVLSEEHPAPVGTLAGHKDGIVFIDSKGDGRYLISNSKDQSIKLWDIRKFSSEEGVKATIDKVRTQTWDYRWEDIPRRARKAMTEDLPGDSSIMTYRGHLVKHSLLRCRFSPFATTGQCYVYTACARGRVIIYDVLTGQVVASLTDLNSYPFCFRDASWHPYDAGVLTASSWDGSLQMWTSHPRPDFVNDSRDRDSHQDFW